MLIEVYAVRDNKINAYGCPFFELQKTNATRAMYVAVNDQNSKLHHFPQDFDLVKLAVYDDSLGKFTQNQVEFVVNLGQLKKDQMLENEKKFQITKPEETK